jgi:hypothetical protein
MGRSAANREMDPTGTEQAYDGSGTALAGPERTATYDAPKSGIVIEPSGPSEKPGLCAISQTWPSGSLKQPA